MSLQSPLKICFVVPKVILFFEPSLGDASGGAERQAYYLGTSLAQREGFEVHYCTASYGSYLKQLKENCQLWPTFNFNDNRLKSFLRICRMLKKIDADVYIFRAANLAIAPLIYYLKFFLRRRCVYMVAHLEEGSPQRLRKMVGWITSAFMSSAYGLADILIVQTAEQEKLFNKRGFDKTRRLPNLFPLALDTVSSPKKYDYSLWVGRCDPWKRPEIFIDLARRHPDEKFVMICPMGRDAALFAWVQSEASKVANLIFLPGVTPDKIIYYYRQAKMYVLTSVSEGFANTMMEAMSQSCPLLSLGIDPDGIICKHELGLVAHDLAGYFRKFKILAEDRDYCRRLGENGKDYLMRNHTGNEPVDRFAGFLEALLAGRH